MTKEQMIKNLQVPKKRIDVVLDTDAFNEIDDQFAIAYMFKNPEKLNVKALYAAPFYNQNSEGPKDGMEKSYNEILKLLSLLNVNTEVFKGSEKYLPDEKTFVSSPAALDLANRAEKYSKENPLYVVAIGAITNIASAILINPNICEKIVVIWLGGNAHHFQKTEEFNMKQDIAAARIVMNSGAPFVQLPCMGVVSEFRISGSELKDFWIGKNAVADYLAKTTIAAAEEYAKGKIWTRVIWDVTAVAWLLNDNGRFMNSRIVNLILPGYDNCYENTETDKPINYVYSIKRDSLMQDLTDKLTKK